MANHVGRPRTKLNDLPADWESIICMAAQDGASDDANNTDFYRVSAVGSNYYSDFEQLSL